MLQETKARGAEQLAPSGDQFQLLCGRQQATVVEVGGGLRRYRIDGHDLLDGYARRDRCTGARGLPLIPWPNRLRDGAYTFNGENHQVPLTEPDKHNAIHGFLRWRNWTCRHAGSDRVVMGTVLRPMMGYPFTLDVEVDYHLDESGLTVTTRARNIGEQTAPYGAGQHPYLQIGTDRIDPGELRLDADIYIPTDDRGLPTGTAKVAGSEYDFRAGRRIGDQDVDLTFTGLHRDGDGRAWVRLTGPDGRRISVWVDEKYPFVEIYTSHTQPAPHFRTGLGVEPMTCAPNAFRSGNGLIRLSPGESVETSWGITGSLPD